MVPDVRCGPTRLQVNKQESIDDMRLTGIKAQQVFDALAGGKTPPTQAPDLAWKECPMPLKTIIMAWDGDTMFGPWSPQTEKERAFLQYQFFITHWLAIPPAPRKLVLPSYQPSHGNDGGGE